MRRLRYNIVFDTNVLKRGGTHELLRKLNKKLARSSTNCKVRYFIPEVVVEEYKYHLLKEALPHIKQFNSVLDEYEILNKRVKIDKNWVERVFKKKLTTSFNKYITIPLPAKIDVRKLMKMAAWKEPPFQEKTEKGFRDSLIMLTIEVEYDRLTRAGARIAFICDDSKFRKAVKEELKDVKNRFSVYNSIDEFESELRLSLQISNRAFKSEITKNATAAFLELVAKEEVEGRIRSDFPDLFVTPNLENYWYGDAYFGNVKDVNEKWEPVGKGAFLVAEPIYVDKIVINKKARFKWESTVTFKQTFRQLSPVALYVVGTYNKMVEYILEFSVKWSAVVDNKGNFSDARVEGIEKKNSYTNEISQSVIGGYSGISMATASGQELKPLSPGSTQGSFIGHYLGEKKCRDCGRSFIPSGVRSLSDEELCDDCWRKQYGG